MRWPRVIHISSHTFPQGFNARTTVLVDSYIFYPHIHTDIIYIYLIIYLYKSKIRCLKS